MEKNGHIDLAKKETANMRIFEATGAGRLLITEHFDNLTEIFKPDDEIITFHEWEDLKEKLLHYTTHPEEAALIAARGFERCMRDHSMKVRVEQLAQIVRNSLHSKPAEEASTAESTLSPSPVDPADPVDPVTPVNPEVLLDEALDQIMAHHYASALEALQSLQSKEVLQDRYYAEALCHLGQGNTALAITALKQELRNFPAHAEASQVLDLLDEAT